MRFSIIIPAYNTEEQIEKCLRSICCQDYSKEGYEIIVVDDCSPDKLSIKVSELQKEFPNIVLIRHDVNKRQGGARNTALKILKGDYVLFVDSDDCWLYTNVLQIFDSILGDEQYDIIQADHFVGIREDDNYKTEKYRGYISPTITNGIDYLLSDSMCFSSCLSCYKMDFIKYHNLFFEENVAYEDVDWRFKVCFLAQTISLIDFPFYGYRLNDTSTTRFPSVKSFEDNIRSVARTKEFIKQEGITGNLYYRCMDYVKSSVFSFLKISRNYKIEDSLQCFKLISNLDLTDLAQYHLNTKEFFLFLVIKHFPIIPIIFIRILTLTKRRFCCIHTHYKKYEETIN